MANQMIFFLSIIGLGLAAALFLFFKEMGKGETVEPIAPPEPSSDEPPSILNRLGINEASAQEMGLTIPTKLASPQPSFQKQSVLPEVKEKKDAVDLNKMATDELSLLELQAKIEKLEATLKEKDATLQRKDEELQKNEKALISELKEKKEFNKTKDLLEKEIKELKDKNHKNQLELGASKTEVESYRNRASQLEEKLKSKEKELKDKEKDVEELAKKLSVFAKPSPQKTTINQVPQPAAVVVNSPSEVKSEAKEELPKETSQEPAKQPVVEPIIQETPKAEEPKPVETAVPEPLKAPEQKVEDTIQKPQEQQPPQPVTQISGPPTAELITANPLEKPVIALPSEEPPATPIIPPVIPPVEQASSAIQQPQEITMTESIAPKPEPVPLKEPEITPPPKTEVEKNPKEEKPQKPTELPKQKVDEKPKETPPIESKGPSLHLYTKILEMKHKNMGIKKPGEKPNPESNETKT